MGYAIKHRKRQDNSIGLFEGVVWPHVIIPHLLVNQVGQIVSMPYHTSFLSKLIFFHWSFLCKNCVTLHFITNEYVYSARAMVLIRLIGKDRPCCLWDQKKPRWFLRSTEEAFALRIQLSRVRIWLLEKLFPIKRTTLVKCVPVYFTKDTKEPNSENYLKTYTRSRTEE